MDIGHGVRGKASRAMKQPALPSDELTAAMLKSAFM